MDEVQGQLGGGINQLTVSDGAQNCAQNALGYQAIGGCWSYPTYTYTPAPTYEIQVRKVANGWIAFANGKEHIITKPEQILKFFNKPTKE